VSSRFKKDWKYEPTSPVPLQRRCERSWERTWGRFNAKREDQLWFYRYVISALRKAGSNPIVVEMERTFGQLEELIDELRGE
jgi:hypothetical protein